MKNGNILYYTKENNVKDNNFKLKSQGLFYTFIAVILTRPFVMYKSISEGGEGTLTAECLQVLILIKIIPFCYTELWSSYTISSPNKHHHSLIIISQSSERWNILIEGFIMNDTDTLKAAFGVSNRDGRTIFNISPSRIAFHRIAFHWLLQPFSKPTENAALSTDQARYHQI